MRPLILAAPPEARDAAQATAWLREVLELLLAVERGAILSRAQQVRLAEELERAWKTQRTAYCPGCDCIACTRVRERFAE
jgi:hypothetical protein